MIKNKILNKDNILFVITVLNFALVIPALGISVDNHLDNKSRNQKELKISMQNKKYELLTDITNAEHMLFKSYQVLNSVNHEEPEEIAKNRKALKEKNIKLRKTFKTMYEKINMMEPKATDEFQYNIEEAINMLKHLNKYHKLAIYQLDETIKKYGKAIKQ